MAEKEKKLRFADNLRKIAGYANAAVLTQNENGDLVGECHPRAVLTNHEIDLMRELYEEYPPGHEKHMGYRRLAKKFEVSKTAARKICNYESRAQYPVKFKRKK